MLQTPEHRKLIKGIIINKFRGDLRLFEEGRKLLEQICKVPVLGVVPMASHIYIDEEDSVALVTKNRKSVSDKINIAVVLLKHISNFTDFNVLERHPEVNLYYASAPEDIPQADIVILPGSKTHWPTSLTCADAGLRNPYSRPGKRQDGYWNMRRLSDDGRRYVTRTVLRRSGQAAWTRTAAHTDGDG